MHFSKQIDKEGADPQKILTSLMSYDILTEEFGGQVQCAKVSAKSGLGIEELLEKVLLQAEVMNLRAPIDTPAMVCMYACVYICLYM